MSCSDKHKSSSASRKTHVMPDSKDKCAAVPHRKECLISPPRHSRPLHPPSIDSNFRHCVNWECSLRPLSTTHSPVAMVIQCYMGNIKGINQHLDYPVLAFILFRPNIKLQSCYLCGRDVLEGMMFLQIPDNHETSSVANNDLVWVYWVLL